MTMNASSIQGQISENNEFLVRQISPSRLNTLSGKPRRTKNEKSSVKPIHKRDSNLIHGIEEEMCKMRNDKFHLELELEQKNQEISRLKSMLLPKLTPPAIDLKDTMTTFNPKIESSVYNRGQKDFATHFSSSSYDGQREDITETSTVATTTTSQKQREHKIFTQDILPFVQKTIDIYRSSHIFSEEIEPIKQDFEAFFDRSVGKEVRCRIFSGILSNIVKIQRLMVAALNRELELKKIDRKMSYLATLFMDPNEYNLPKDQYLEEIKQQMLDVILSIYGEVPKISRDIERRDKRRDGMSTIHVSAKPELVPIGYTSEKTRLDRKKNRNIKLTPFKSVAQENNNDGPDLSDPLHLLLTERLNLSSLEDSISTNQMKSL